MRVHQLSPPEEFDVQPDDLAVIAESLGSKRMVNDGTSATAQAVTLVWNDDSNGWTAVTGSGEYADHDVVFVFA